MKDLIATGLCYVDGALRVLDQRRLPQQEHWRTVQDEHELVELIRGLAIRGAPLIGIAAALWAGHVAERGATPQQLTQVIALLRGSRPTAVNLVNYLDRLQAHIDAGVTGPGLAMQAEAIFEQDVALCAAMAEHGAALIGPGDRLLTHCNTGGLATAGVGTAIGVITTAFRQGKQIRVWVDETRPLLQGARLTAWEMEQAGVPYRLICDSMAAGLMAAGEVDRVLVGADRIALNGDFANKVGTYSLAVIAHYHGVPFYVVAPHTTVDTACTEGGGIPIEQRQPAEVRGAAGSFGEVCWSPAQAPVFNPAFDITPAKLVTGWVFDTGVYSHEQIAAGALCDLQPA